MANDMLNTKKLITKVLNRLDNPIKAVDFQTTPSSYTTGSKTYTMSIPSGYKVVSNKPYEIYASGHAQAYITDRTISVSGSTLTIDYYLYNPANASNLVVIGSVLFVKDGGANLSINTDLVDMIYPVGSYYETSDTTFDPNTAWGGTWVNVKRNVMRTNGSATVSKAQNYTLCTLTLEPNTRYLILGNTTSGSGTNHQMIATFQVTSSAVVSTQLGPARVTTGSGGGCTAYLYASTGDASATVYLQCYGYYTTSHTENGVIIAIPLDHQSAGNVWHRTA